MTLYEFNQIDPSERVQYLWEHGTYVCNDPRAPSNFYTMGEFYVEVRIDQERARIAEVVSFSTGDRYERMVACMKIVDLFETRSTQ